ncbi:MAG: tRNA (adenosine(37)-N6)-threonylcarbamoyltransferase complex dimerization subunit type 1 TsaB [Dysgonamonadaceae bacterium]|jgi:tRNA threonylcarbamoyladenosine biosynthesis protein TsaB|nr:tRNA (adenosine(37)-N6)-threonylcarbamoyltransferase complex dimerization subunit type 1 TsaB [Dysgonamonadaceae bacterium]
MPCLLTIETATPVCSVALSVEGKSIFYRSDTAGAAHAAVLGVFASEAVNDARERGLAIDAVAVSAGPGSYTGLRIGISEAKGLCYGLGIPLIAVPTLKIIACRILQQRPGGYACPMIDARRMEVYAALYDARLNEIRMVQADSIDENSYSGYLEKQTVIFAGNGSDKCRTVIRSPNAVFLENIYPTAQAMIPLAEAAFARREFADTAYFEPFYLKEFQATVGRNKVLGTAFVPAIKKQI